MDMRQDSSENKIYFQSDRIVRVNRGYFFQCRGEVEYGPYPDLKTANLKLASYIEEKKRVSKKRVKKAVNLITALPTDVVQTEQNSLFEEILSEFDAYATHSFAAKEVMPATAPTKQSDFKSTDNVFAIKSKAVKPKEIQHKIAFEPTEVEEYILGVTIGTLRVVDATEEFPFTYTLSDDRFEMIGETLKLKPSEFFDCDADSPVSIGILAENKVDKKCKKTIVIEIIPLES